MAIQSLRDLFEYELKGTYYVENELVDRLPMMADGVTNDKMRNGFSTHAEETQNHVDNLEQVFDELGISPEMREDETLKGLLEEKHKFDQEVQDDDLRNLFYLGAGMKVEHMEITAYKNLIMLAKKLDLSNDVVDLLDENLDNEEKTLTKLETLSEGSEWKSMLNKLMG